MSPADPRDAARFARKAGSLRVWLAAARPATLGAAVAPVAVGCACARAAGGFRAGPAAAALVGALAIQVGTNFVNDAADAARGADDGERLGPTRAVAAGLLSARAVLRAAAVAFAVAAAAGVYLAVAAGPIVVAIGLASVAAGVAYTAGPWPLAYHGLGDAFVLAFFGEVATVGTELVQRGRASWLAAAAGAAVGALATAILVVNNLRDRAGDARAGKRTLAVRLGRRGTIAEYRLLLAVAYAVPIALAMARRSGWALLPVATLPFAVALAVAVARREGRALNATLAATARLALAHGLLLAAGIAA